jgi:hypothetical protein
LGGLFFSAPTPQQQPSPLDAFRTPSSSPVVTSP